MRLIVPCGRTGSTARVRMMGLDPIRLTIRSEELHDSLPIYVDDEYPKYGIGGVDDAAYRAMRENRQYRVVTDDGLGPHPTDYRMWGLATPEGFDPFLSVQYKQTIQHWVPFRTNRLFDTDVRNENMLQTLGVRYVLVREGTEHDSVLAASPDFRLIGRKDIFCHVYQYLHAKPPFHW